MTTEELQNYLIKNSPFKFEGDSKELFYFSDDSFSIDKGEKINYKLSKTGDNFTFEVNSLIPVFQNIKIKVSDKDDTTVVLNFNSQKLKNDTFRNKDAVDGFFILKPIGQFK